MRKAVLVVLAALLLLCGCVKKDTVAPQLVSTALTVSEGESRQLCELLQAVDDTDGELLLTPQMIEGEYDLQRAGSYALTAVLTDSSGNSAIIPFTLEVQAIPVSGEDEHTASCWSSLLGVWSGMDYGNGVYILHFYTQSGQRMCEYGVYGEQGELVCARVASYSANADGSYFKLKLESPTQQAQIVMQLYPDMTFPGRMRAIFEPQNFKKGVEYKYIGAGKAALEDVFPQYTK